MGSRRLSLQHGGQRCDCYWTRVRPNKGHVVEPLPKRVRPSQKRGLEVKVKLARDVIREVCGFTPYERRAMEFLSQGFDKRALKFQEEAWNSPAWEEETSGARGRAPGAET